MMPLLRSKLFAILMTFQVMNNVDTCFTEAYAALMANTLLKLIEMEDSSWKQGIMDQIYYTFKAVYYEHEEFVLHRKSMEGDFRQCLVSEHPKLERQHCEDPIKAFLLVYCLLRDGDERVCARVEEIAECLTIEIVARCMDRSEELLNMFVVEGQKVNE